MKYKLRIGGMFLVVTGIVAVSSAIAWLFRPARPNSPPFVDGRACPPDGSPSRAAAGELPPPRLRVGMVGMTRFVAALSGLAIVATAAGIAGMVHNTHSQNRQEAIALTGGDPIRGETAINAYGCASCHTIPGIHGANAQVGPPLTQIGGRTYVGGVLANTPDNMVHWILDPPAIDEKTAMPNLHVTETDARDIACYLYTLR